MARRKPFTRVEKTNQIRAGHVRGMGDVVFKGFHCLNPECQNFIFVRKDSITEFFDIKCGACGYAHAYGDESKFYDFNLVDLRSGKTIESGGFTILHDEYIAEAQEYKYCIICNTLKPLSSFDQHSARSSGRQGECRLCKAVYNDIKNQTRTADQHREAAQKRRLYMELSGAEKIDSIRIYERFEYRCFKCGKDLSKDLEAKTDVQGGNLDHTLPARWLWPLTTENATLLCSEHNGDKADSWPSDFYTDRELRRLVTLTGIPYEVLTAAPHYNPEALEKLHHPEFVEALLEKYAPYMAELMLVRNRILRAAGFDFFSVSKKISRRWIRTANSLLSRSVTPKPSTGG